MHNDRRLVASGAEMLMDQINALVERMRRD